MATKTPTSSLFKDLVKQTLNEDSSPGPYSQLICSLLWIAQCTNLNVSFSVNKLSQFLCDPSHYKQYQFLPRKKWQFEWWKTYRFT
jgi:hypothetical protein